MTREEKIAEAAHLRADGWTYQQIGAEFGVTHSCVMKWLNPERTREWQKHDTANPATRARKRAWDAGPGRGICAECGGPMGKNSASRNRSRCWECWQARVEANRAAIVAGYRTGTPAPQIAEQTGILVATVRSEAYRMRRRGVDVPFGRPGPQVERSR